MASRFTLDEVGQLLDLDDFLRAESESEEENDEEIHCYSGRHVSNLEDLTAIQQQLIVEDNEASDHEGSPAASDWQVWDSTGGEEMDPAATGNNKQLGVKIEHDSSQNSFSRVVSGGI